MQAPGYLAKQVKIEHVTHTTIVQHNSLGIIWAGGERREITDCAAVWQENKGTVIRFGLWKPEMETQVAN